MGSDLRQIVGIDSAEWVVTQIDRPIFSEGLVAVAFDAHVGRVCGPYSNELLGERFTLMRVDFSTIGLNAFSAFWRAVFRNGSKERGDAGDPDDVRGICRVRVSNLGVRVHRSLGCERKRVNRLSMTRLRRSFSRGRNGKRMKRSSVSVGLSSSPGIGGRS